MPASPGTFPHRERPQPPHHLLVGAAPDDDPRPPALDAGNAIVVVEDGHASMARRKLVTVGHKAGAVGVQGLDDPPPEIREAVVFDPTVQVGGIEPEEVE